MASSKRTRLKCINNPAYNWVMSELESRTLQYWKVSCAFYGHTRGRKMTTETGIKHLNSVMGSLSETRPIWDAAATLMDRIVRGKKKEPSNEDTQGD